MLYRNEYVCVCVFYILVYVVVSNLFFCDGAVSHRAIDIRSSSKPLSQKPHPQRSITRVPPSKIKMIFFFIYINIQAKVTLDT